MSYSDRFCINVGFVIPFYVPSPISITPPWEREVEPNNIHPYKQVYPTRYYEKYILQSFSQMKDMFEWWKGSIDCRFHDREDWINILEL